MKSLDKFCTVPARLLIRKIQYSEGGPGIEKVLLTAPGDGIPNIVYGVNHEDIEDEIIVSAASCTTNAIVPPIKIIDENFGIEKGLIGRLGLPKGPGVGPR